MQSQRRRRFVGSDTTSTHTSIFMAPLVAGIEMGQELRDHRVKIARETKGRQTPAINNARADGVRPIEPDPKPAPRRAGANRADALNQLGWYPQQSVESGL